MAELSPVVVCLSRSGEATARRVAAALGAAVHGREGRVEDADATFANALEHVRTLFAARTPIIGIRAAGILIRAVPPPLADKPAEPPVVEISEGPEPPSGGVVSEPSSGGGVPPPPPPPGGSSQ